MGSASRNHAIHLGWLKLTDVEDELGDLPRSLEATTFVHLVPRCSPHDISKPEYRARRGVSIIEAVRAESNRRMADAPRVEEGRDEREHVAEKGDRFSDDERDGPTAKDDGYPGRPSEHGVLVSMPGALAEDLEEDGARSDERVQDTAACKKRCARGR